MLLDIMLLVMLLLWLTCAHAQSCGQGCRDCKSDGSCRECQSGYYKQIEIGRSICLECPQGCSRCVHHYSTNSTICYNCDSGYQLSHEYTCSACTGVQCAQCDKKPGYWGYDCHYSCTSCRECASEVCKDWCWDREGDSCVHNNTQQCPDNKCSVWFGGPRKNETGTNAQSCGQGCGDCRSDGNCQWCHSGYHNQIQDGRYICLECPQGCTKCSYHSSTNSTICRNCYSGYYLSHEYTCSACTGGICGQCEDKPGYWGYDCSVSCTKCSECASEGCKMLCSDTQGDVCLHHNNTQRCADSKCSFWFGGPRKSDTDAHAQTCGKGCRDCKSDGSCRVCHSGYYKQFQDGRYICLECPKGCSRCIHYSSRNSTDCYNCDSGYYLSHEYTCSACTGVQCAQCDEKPGYWGYACRYSCTSCRECASEVCKDMCWDREGDRCLHNNKQQCPDDKCSAWFGGPRKNVIGTHTQSCGQGCGDCRSDGTCHWCYSGYYEQVQDGRYICLECPQGCSKCSYYSSTNSTICRNCYSGYYLSHEHTCSACTGGICGQCADKPGYWGYDCSYSCTKCSECVSESCKMLCYETEGDICLHYNNTPRCADSKCSLWFGGPRKSATVSMVSPSLQTSPLRTQTTSMEITLATRQTATRVPPIMTTIATRQPTTRVLPPKTTLAIRQPTTRVSSTMTTLSTRQPTTRVLPPMTTLSTRQPTTRVLQPMTTLAIRQPTTRVLQPMTTLAIRQPTTRVLPPITTIATRQPTTRVLPPMTTLAIRQPTTRVLQPMATLPTRETTTMESSSSVVYIIVSVVCVLVLGFIVFLALCCIRRRQRIDRRRRQSGLLSQRTTNEESIQIAESVIGSYNVPTTDNVIDSNY